MLRPVWGVCVSLQRGCEQTEIQLPTTMDQEPHAGSGQARADYATYHKSPSLVQHRSPDATWGHPGPSDPHSKAAIRVGLNIFKLKALGKCQL